MFDELTDELLDLTASVRGTADSHLAMVVYSCCCSCCCGCLFFCW